jgi:hypothetical protein
MLRKTLIKRLHGLIGTAEFLVQPGTPLRFFGQTVGTEGTGKFLSQAANHVDVVDAFPRENRPVIETTPFVHHQLRIEFE